MTSEYQNFPHYSEAASRMSQLGGLDMYFAAHGHEANEWVRHVDSLVPERTALFYEGYQVSSRLGDPVDSTLFGRRLADVAGKRGTVVLPGGYGGDRVQSRAPGFRDGELGDHLHKLHAIPDHLLTDEHIERYTHLNAIREMRAAIGSIAWLAVHLDANVGVLTGRPVSLWGRQHQRSLPDMYDRLGVEPIDITVIDAAEQSEVLPIHAHRWTDEELQMAFEESHQHAKLHHVYSPGNSADID